MIAARTVGDPGLPGDDRRNGERVDKVIEDFDRAVDVEALCLAKKSGKHSLFSIMGIVHSQ
jgi:hypothetical protein